MPLFLKKRNTSISERMDDPYCDEQKLHNTYKHFYTINKALSGWKQIFYTHILPYCNDKTKSYTLLDIGFGGGDIPLLIDSLARKNNVQLTILGIETDARALEYVNDQTFPDSIRFRNCSTKILVEEKASFDFVICNHVLHHLSEREVKILSVEALQLSKTLCLFNDLRRSDLAYLLFWMLTLVPFRNSFIRTDGLISIRRSYTPAELKSCLEKGWSVNKLFAFRILALHEKKTS
jgi:2-polyprenyl-3-methyl-5-hydroxy-6-metoxy-1,4-benzoquinol methylase